MPICKLCGDWTIWDNCYCNEIPSALKDNKHAPAQEEKEMEKVCKKHQIRSLQGEPCGSCTADLRQLHRDAALAALSGCCAKPVHVWPDGSWDHYDPATTAIGIADEFIRQYNPNAVIAEGVNNG